MTNLLIRSLLILSLTMFKAVQKQGSISDRKGKHYDPSIISKNNLPNKQPSIYCQPYSSSTTTIHPILHLQQTIGNQAVQRLVRSGMTQTKIKVSQLDDVYEKEADRVAEKIMHISAPQGDVASIHTINKEKIKRKCQSCQDEENVEKMIHRKTDDADEYQIPEDVLQSIDNIRGGGFPLDESTREFMEPRFGADFSNIRIHTDESADKLANTVNAKAFTIGQDIMYSGGEYSPSTVEGRRLLAHELTHVIQQGMSKPTSTQSNLITASITPSSESKIYRKADIHELDTKLAQEDKNQDLDESDLEDIGLEVLQKVGYHDLIKMAFEAGFLKKKEGSQDAKVIQRQAATLSASVPPVVTFGSVFTRYAVAAGIASQVDTPAPGPGDILAIGILAVGLFAAGYAVLRSRPRAQIQIPTRTEPRETPLPIPVPVPIPREESRDLNQMGFQVQWNTRYGGPTFSEKAMAPSKIGVTAAQAIEKLNAAHAKVVPEKARIAAEPAKQLQMRRIMNIRAGGGITKGGLSIPEYFKYKRYTDPRIDLINIRGHNLKF